MGFLFDLQFSEWNENNILTFQVHVNDKKKFKNISHTNMMAV
jgi:hypothetical protein